MATIVLCIGMCVAHADELVDAVGLGGVVAEAASRQKSALQCGPGFRDDIVCSGAACRVRETLS